MYIFLLLLGMRQKSYLFQFVNGLSCFYNVPLESHLNNDHSGNLYEGKHSDVHVSIWNMLFINDLGWIGTISSSEAGSDSSFLLA